MALLTALNLFVLILLSILVLALYVDLRGQRKTLAALAAAAEKGHGNGYPGPSAAAVVTEPEPASGPMVPPVPAVARPALPSVARSVVSVTRDDDPVHTRATVAAPQPSSGAAAMARQTSRRRELDEATRGRLRRVSREEKTAARAAWAEVETERTERTALEMARRIAAEDRETPEEEEGGESPPESEGREISLAKQARLNAEEIARVDALAAQQGMTREELLAALVEHGLEVVKGPPRGRR